jgi:hypothetical protein
LTISLANAEKPGIEDEFYISVARRGLEKKAPFHKERNSIADAILLEIFRKMSNSFDKDQFHFITHNTHDFSRSTDDRLIHSDYAAYFNGTRVRYSINLRSELTEIDPDVLEEVTSEYEWALETRGLTEILECIDEFEQKIWYGRHGLLADGVKKGEIKVVETSKCRKYNPKKITKEIWGKAQEAAKRVENEFPDDHGPWDEFEWGMLNGKLATLRWVLGDEWDMLDT